MFPVNGESSEEQWHGGKTRALAPCSRAFWNLLPEPIVREGREGNVPMALCHSACGGKFQPMSAKGRGPQLAEGRAGWETQRVCGCIRWDAAVSARPMLARERATSASVADLPLAPRGSGSAGADSGCARPSSPLASRSRSCPSVRSRSWPGERAGVRAPHTLWVWI